jgi:hypothetical protein
MNTVLWNQRNIPAYIYVKCTHLSEVIGLEKDIFTRCIPRIYYDCPCYCAMWKRSVYAALYRPAVGRSVRVTCVHSLLC